MLRNLDIALVRTFVAVADSNNMTIAAERLHLTQGAVSQQIRRLEESIDCKLFNRHRRMLRLSGQGAKFLKHANDLLELNDGIINDITAPAIGGTICLGIPYDLVTPYLPLMLQGFSDVYPEIDIALSCEASGNLIAMVANGDLDIAIVEEPADSISGECLRTERLVWIGSKKTAKQRPLPLSLVSETCVFRPAIHDALKNADIIWRTVFENGNLEATMTTVRAGLTISASLLGTIPEDLEILSAEQDLPQLPSFSICLHLNEKHKISTVDLLANNIRKEFLT